MQLGPTKGKTSVILYARETQILC
ncbi:uncharacterized protein METZ01_LOCUS378390 [marine metagenome]|uniref:Uncharacterized protein n=1 Tax=marine metagenome TaxID=408172 RepID=A0A382TU03_9ZZZZ